MKLGNRYIVANADGTVTLKVKFLLAAEEHVNDNPPALTRAAQRELAQNIDIINYGFNGLVHGDGRSDDYKLKIQPDNAHGISLKENNDVVLTQNFNISAESAMITLAQIMDDVARIFEDEVSPAFQGPDEAVKLARLPIVGR